MGRDSSRVFRIGFQVNATFILLGFILTAVGGIVLLTSTSVLHSTIQAALKGYKGDAEDLRQFVAFMLEFADIMAIYSVVFGVALAFLALIGLIASCRGWYKMLKIYAIIMGILLVVQIIVIAVVYSNPTKYVHDIVSSLKKLLKSYGDDSEEGKKATAIWNVLMETEPQCCGMDGYMDFEKLHKHMPHSCCSIKNAFCDTVLARISNVKGCRSKIERIAKLRSEVLLYISIAMMFTEASLIVLVILMICTAKDEVSVEE